MSCVHSKYPNLIDQIYYNYIRRYLIEIRQESKILTSDDADLLRHALWLCSNLFTTRADYFVADLERMNEFMEGVEDMMDVPSYQAPAEEALFCLGRLILFVSADTSQRVFVLSNLALGRRILRLFMS